LALGVGEAQELLGVMERDLNPPATAPLKH
jgi:hypothetical protein